MYEEFYRLKEKPFNLTPDPRYLYLGSHHREALDFLSSGMGKKGADFIVLTGEIGSGKTILLRSFLKDHAPSYELIQVFYPTHDCVQLLQMILLNMGVKSVKGDLEVLHEELTHRLTELHRMNKNLLLVIDEAQHLGEDAIKETFRLSRLQDNGRRFLKVILSGLPELQTKVSALHSMYRNDEATSRQEQNNDSLPDNAGPQGDAAAYQELHDKVSSLRSTDIQVDVNDDNNPQVDISTYHLKNLPAEEVPQYIRYRLNVAGGSGSDIFAEEVISEIGRYSGGTPRLIDMICNASLVTGYMIKEKVISLSTLREVIDRQFRDIMAEEGSELKMPDPGGAHSDGAAEEEFSAVREEQKEDTLLPKDAVNTDDTVKENPADRNMRTAPCAQPELNILILEKNARIKVHLENSFQKYGYKSLAVSSIEELIETLEHSEEREFHILVLDAGFFFTEGGREDTIGRSALDRIKTTYTYLPLIMTSALPLSSMRTRLSELGIPYLIQKPDVSRVDLSRITTQFNNFFEELKCCIDNISSRFSAFYQRFMCLDYQNTDKVS